MRMIAKKKIIYAVITLVLSSMLCGCIEEEPQPPVFTEEDIAVQLMQYFVNGTIQDSYTTFFSSEVQNQTSPEQLEMIWDQLLSQYGDFDSIISRRITQEYGYTVVYLTCRYSKLGELDTRVVFDDNKLIAGLQFVPTDTSDEYQPPEYTDLDEFSEMNVTIGDGTEWALDGIISLPDGDGMFPAVILVHGSGPNDQDETIGPNKPFKDLAWGLASNGIAVLRYVKRTKQYSDVLVDQLANITVFEETIDDVWAAVDLLGSIDAIDPNQIFVLGHSLGGMLAPRIAINRSDIRGLILMAAPVRSLDELVLNQTMYLAELDGTITDEEQVQIDLVSEYVEKIQMLNITDNEVVLGAGRAYWEDLAGYNAVSTAEQLNIPLLILQGERDYQVTYTDDYLVWQDTFNDNENVSFQSYALLNHLFIAGSGPSSNVEYNTPGNVEEEVILDIVEWIDSIS